MSVPTIPLATYRLQLSATLGFSDAARLVPYLHALGVTHLYASPFLKARKGSTHGYDIIDHAQLNPEFGGEDGFSELSSALASAGMGLILDFVPNHMGVGHDDNLWWLDVLEWGPRSPHAASFDIDWEGLPNRREPGILLPILGRPYAEALESGEIELKYDAGAGTFSAWYFDHKLPIRPSRYSEVIRTLVAASGAEDTATGRSLTALAARYSTPDKPGYGDAPALKRALAAIDGAPEVLAAGLHVYRPDGSGGDGDLARAATLHRLLERQYYRLAHWRVAVSDINYRRFFDVSDLAGIRVEDWKTFLATHRLVAQLIAEGRLHGLRLDHIDGLFDPVRYCQRLTQFIRRSRRAATGVRAAQQPFYILVEKILADGERMPALPGVAGTTGYEILNDISRVLLDARGMPGLDATWRGIPGAEGDFEKVVRDAKALIIDGVMASEFSVLARLLSRVAAGHWPSRDYTLTRMRAALRLYVIHFPVYRTYLNAKTVSPEDRATITATIQRARTDWEGPDHSIFDFIQDALTMDLVAPGRVGYGAPRVQQFAMKVQQFTGPVMAKALEDTSFYRYHRLLALNEVGGEPSLPGLRVDDFHRRMIERAIHAPHALTTTATHDTKRGEDARMRILALSEMVYDWALASEGWATRNAALRDDPAAPSSTHEYMLYQALLGAWPQDGPDEDFIARMQGYAVKAAREGKQNTSWINPNASYEAALTGFVAALLDPARSAEFLDEFAALAERASLMGALNSLSQLTLKLMLPGVPDIYQGTESWDLSLVDPDNRRDVDFLRRIREGTSLATAPLRDLAGNWRDGRIKHALMLRLLGLRNDTPRLFTEGRYEPLTVNGADADRVIAFARTHRSDAIIVAMARRTGKQTRGGRVWPRPDAWDATLDLGGYRITANALENDIPTTSTHTPIHDLFGAIPIAVFTARRR